MAMAKKCKKCGEYNAVNQPCSSCSANCSDASHELIKVAAELVARKEIPYPDDKMPTHGEIRELMASDCKRANRLKKAADAMRDENKRLVGLIRNVIAGDWCVTDLQEAIGDV